MTNTFLHSCFTKWAFVAVSGINKQCLGCRRVACRRSRSVWIRETECALADICLSVVECCVSLRLSDLRPVKSAEKSAMDRSTWWGIREGLLPVDGHKWWHVANILRHVPHASHSGHSGSHTLTTDDELREALMSLTYPMLYKETGSSGKSWYFGQFWDVFLSVCAV